MSETPVAVTESDRRSSHDLTDRFRWLLFAITLPLFIVILLLAVNQYGNQRMQVLQILSQSSATYAIAVEDLAKLASDHVMRMQAWSESYLANPSSLQSELRAYFTQRLTDGKPDGYSLDGVPESRRPFVGQLGWLEGDPRQPNVGGPNLDFGLEFFSIARLQHSVTPHFQWSFFFSAEHKYVAVYPWASTEDLYRAGGQATLESIMDAWFGYELYLAGTPDENPERRPYWTAPYIDAGGTGAMVSHGAPLYLDGRFHGVVGTDLRLATLGEFLAGLPRKVGRLMVLDDKGVVLADTLGTAIDKIRTATDVLSASLADRRLVDAPDGAGEPQVVAGQVLVARGLKHAPWTLVYLVNAEEIWGLLLPRLIPYAVILVVLGVTVFLALYLLRREFISPALTLVDYIRDASQDPAVTEPRLPRRWRVWANLVSRTFADNREASRRLQDSEERLQQILNNSSAVVYARDREGRFLLINQPFARLFGITQDEILGKPLEALFPPETVAEFRSNDMLVLEQSRVMEFEEKVVLEDGVHTYISIKFPLYDSQGSIYAICGISTDITRRKQSEVALHQAALGVSEAQGEGVLNSLVTHLAKAVGTDWAIIGVLDGEDRIRTRAVYAHGRIEAEFTYPLEGSPCQDVIGQRFRFYPDRIQQRFPEDVLLREIHMESYAAIPLFGTDGDVLGLLAVLDGLPLKDQPLVETILQVFSGRAASELERERTDVALRASEASYRAIFEATEDSIFVHDLNSGVILDVNPRACEVYGYTREEMRTFDVGQVSSGVPPYTQEYAAKLIARAVAGERMRFEWHRKSRDGSLHWDEVYLRRASIAGKDRILAFTREITARKEAEEKLSASEEQYRSIFDAASDAMILWNEAGEIVDLNPATWRIGGYTKDEFLAIPVERHIHSSSRQDFKEFTAAVVNGRSIHVEATALRKDGSVLHLETRTVPMQYRGKPHVLSLSRDITEQKRADEELARQREALRQSEKLSAMGELLAGVAHELNNPLAILMGRTALLQKKSKDSGVQSDVDKIHTAAERCGRIVRTFLSMAKQKPPERKHGNLNDVVASALELLGYGLRTSGIELEFGRAENLPQQCMDIDQVGQIVINLLVNAQHVVVEQPEPRSILVETGLSEGNAYVRVTDNGPGVPAELRQRIFDPFFTTKEGNVGTGIGLSVSRGIAREHGGDLLLEETVSGASFSLLLPLEALPETAEVANRSSVSIEDQSGHALVVEDEPEIGAMLVEILESAGIRATWASSGLEATKWLEDHPCDLILSDIRMPDMDGPALWRTLKRLRPDLIPHMAFISGDTLSATITPFLKETGAPLLEKPFTPEQVLALVARIEQD